MVEHVLIHHGIKGQRWGVRRYQNLDGTLTAAGKLRYSSQTHGFPKIIGKKKDKRGKKTSSVVDIDGNLKKYQNERRNEVQDSSTGLYLKNRKTSVQDDLKRVNPSFKDGYQYQSNCTMCTAALELRIRGYDVHACGCKDRNGVSTSKSEKFFGGTKNKRTLYSGGAKPADIKKLADDTVSEMKKDGPGARGELLLDSKYCGHSMMYIVNKNNEIILLDGQSGKQYNENQAKEYIKNYSAIETSCKRIDNLTPNIDFMKKNNVIC